MDLLSESFLGGQDEGIAIIVLGTTRLQLDLNLEEKNNSHYNNIVNSYLFYN